MVGEGRGLEQKRVRVLPIRVGPPASCTLCCQVGGGGAALASRCVCVWGGVPHHFPVPGRARSP